jgi:PHD/YefM family antitoxin component YafN of YafNO toxin-antitoxin module
MQKIILTSAELHRAPSKARKLADTDPVFVTHRGQESHVLLSVEEYRRLASDFEAWTVKEQLETPNP